MNPSDVEVFIDGTPCETMDLEPGEGVFFGKCAFTRVIIRSESWFDVLERAVREYKAAHS